MDLRLCFSTTRDPSWLVPSPHVPSPRVPITTRPLVCNVQASCALWASNREPRGAIQCNAPPVLASNVLSCHRPSLHRSIYHWLWLAPFQPQLHGTCREDGHLHSLVALPPRAPPRPSSREPSTSVPRLCEAVTRHAPCVCPAIVIERNTVCTVSSSRERLFKRLLQLTLDVYGQSLVYVYLPLEHHTIYSWIGHTLL